MPDKLLFEYATIRVVPRVEREEFLNVGVVLFCAKAHFLQTAWHVPTDRLRAFCGDTPVPHLWGGGPPQQAQGFDQFYDDLTERLRAFERVCLGQADGGPIGQLPPANRFRWLTAARSTVLQTSPVHPGLCTDPAETLDRLFRQLVL